jgi:hypothetical protein
MDNVATYSEARSEYTKQMATFIVPQLVTWFQQTWKRNSADKQRCLALFQSECEEVSRWNQDRIQDEVRVLIERSGCDYMEDLMTAVFIAHTKVLTAVGISNDRKKKLSISVPKLDHFLHRVFREAARCFWKTPFLFMETGGVVDRQKNILQIEALANEALATAVRSMLPVKQILKDYLDGDQEEIEEDEVVPAAAMEEEEDKSNENKHEETTTNESTVTEDKPTGETSSAPTLIVSDISTTNTTTEPSIVNIDTEPAVHFSDYDSVFDDARGGPELRYSPKDAITHADDDDDDDEDGPSDTLHISSDSKELSIGDDFEDLEATAKIIPPPKKEDMLDAGDFEILE